MSLLTDQLRLAVIVLIICLLPLSKAYNDDETVVVADDDQLLERSVGDRQDRTEVDSLHAFFFTDKNRHNNFFVAISFF